MLTKEAIQLYLDKLIVAGAESAGIFSLAFRDKRHGMIVGGDYRKPNQTGATAATTHGS